MKIPSYPKVWNLGHPRVLDLLSGPVYVQEKVDGSQFSFGVIGEELVMRSKGAQVYPEAADELFRPAVETVLRLYEEGKLKPGNIYRGEALCRPKHNTLKYGRVPEGNIALFDVQWGEQVYADPKDLPLYAEYLGIESVPLLWYGEIEDAEAIRGFLKTDSFLGGCKIEGVVIKNYARFGPDGKPLMAKHVSEAFKESHSKEWARSNPTRSDVIEKIIETLRTEARWKKAIQHLEEAGILEHSPRDIGKLLSELQRDVFEEEGDFIRDTLFEHFKKQIARGVSRGFPEFYKQLLMERQFRENP